MTTIKLQFDEQTLERVQQLAVLRHSTIEILVKEMIELLSVIEVPDDSLLGMFAQEPELINQVVESAMKARETTPLRLPNG